MDNVLDEIEKQYHTKKIEYPVAEFIIVLGFFLVLIIEQVVMDFKERWLYQKSKDQTHVSNSCHSEDVNVQEPNHDINETSSLLGNPGEPLSTALARDRLSATNSPNRRKPGSKINDQNNYGSTVAASSSFKIQHVISNEEEPIQQNNNDICR